MEANTEEPVEEASGDEEMSGSGEEMLPPLEDEEEKEESVESGSGEMEGSAAAPALEAEIEVGSGSGEEAMEISGSGDDLIMSTTSGFYSVSVLYVCFIVKFLSVCLCQIIFKIRDLLMSYFLNSTPYHPGTSPQSRNQTAQMSTKSQAHIQTPYKLFRHPIRMLS